MTMRETNEELRAISKKWPYPNYIIIPAAGSLFSNPPADMTRERYERYMDHVLKRHGAHRDAK